MKESEADRAPRMLLLSCRDRDVNSERLRQLVRQTEFAGQSGEEGTTQRKSPEIYTGVFLHLLLNTHPNTREVRLCKPGNGVLFREL